MKNTFKIAIQILLALLFTGIISASETKFITGIDANYSLNIKNSSKNWNYNDTNVDLFILLKNHNINWQRLRIWTADTGMSSFDYAVNVAKWAQKAGLKIHPVLFLSDNWADLMKQPVPDKWKNLSESELIVNVRDYSYNIIKKLNELNINTELIAIGNEIDFGICGIYAEQNNPRENPEWLKKTYWPKEAAIIMASLEGIKKANSESKIVLHIAHWWDTNFCIKFFNYMTDYGIKFDYAGLSYYPSSGLQNPNTIGHFNQNINIISNAINKQILISEYAYPNSSDIKGQFSTWNKPVDDYPLTDEGQFLWIKDFFNYCNTNPNIVGSFYWSGEWFTDDMWKNFSFFDENGNAKKALQSFIKKTE